jgi:TonB family protein
MIALLDLVWRSSAVLLLGLALMSLLRRQSAALRHWVLAAALLCAAALPVFSAFVPAWSTPLDVSTFVPRQIAAPVTPAPAGAVPAAASDAAASTAVAQGTLAGPPLASTLVRIWSIGAILSLAALGLGLSRLSRLTRTARPVRAGVWPETLDAVRDATGVQRRVDVLVTDRPALPLVCGLVRPLVIVPSAALRWPPERVRAVLNHELAHIRRHDWALQLASELVRAVYWFNPLVWIACARLRIESEIACDDFVINGGAAGRDYAAHVVDIARDLNTRSWVPAPAIVRASTLERRVRAMLDQSLDRRPPSTRKSGGALACLLVITIAIAGLGAQSFVSLSGTIVDPSNGALPGVKLILSNEQTQAKYEIKSDRTGHYEFVGLPPGTYRLDAELPGFMRFDGRVTIASQNLQQDLTLSVGEIQETITVRQDATPPAPNPDVQRRVDEIKAKRAANRCPGGQPGGDVRIGGNIRVPVKYRDVRPHYPEALRGTEGVVVLKTSIGTTGNVEDIEVVSSPHPEFAQSAIDAVRLWEFDATLLNCEPIVTPMKVTVSYVVK